MIIGLTGSISSGKGAVAEFLKSKDMIYLSLSDEVREEAKNRKIEITRENLQNLGNAMREKEGNGVLAKRVIKKIKSQKYSNVIIDGIRNPDEITELKKLSKFFLVAVDAPQEIRFKRLVSRNRESDPKTWQDFIKIDNRDLGINEKSSGQQVGKCIQMADVKIINNKTVEDLNNDVAMLLKELQKKLPRPSWDEYFMKQAALVAERSTCLRRNVGAVIVKNKRIMTTGYNGAAAGTKDCLQRGCLRDEMNIKSGERHEICRAIHAEQNAIIQAALHGLDISGGTLYCSHPPCMICAKMIANVKIKEFVTYGTYADESGLDFLKECGLIVRRIERPEPFISFKD
jgi:dCMP deaminase